MIFTLERLMDRAEAADSDGTLVDAINGSAFGFVYQLAVQYRRSRPRTLPMPRRPAARFAWDASSRKAAHRP